jgi:NAD(P)-dependent dehydrogenase (short-subunit alcohol dehydrogenase family)
MAKRRQFQAGRAGSSPTTGSASVTQQDKPVWFITGCSTGFGRELARYTLDRGYRVVVTARKPAEIADLAVGHEARALVQPLDVTKPDQIAASVAAAEAKFGQIEESDDSEIRRMFEINFWGLANMTRAALPGMRKRRTGHIVNISSMGGIRGAPAVGYYNATKFALEGFSEALAQETAPLGIKVLIIEPSGFRTDWAGRSANETPNPIADYDSTAGARARQIRGYSGKQPGDPVRAAAAIVKAVEAPDAPLRLMLGKAALAAGRSKVEALSKDFESWAAVTEGADFPDA